MSYDSWTCLMVHKGPGMLDENVKRALKFSACDLYLKRQDLRKMKSDVCEGVLKTEWSTQTVGAQSGILFKAHIESSSGEYFVNFLMNEQDLALGAELVRAIEEEGLETETLGERIPCAELYQFENLRGPSRMLH